MLAPRVNAAGRMSTPDIATRLLLASDEAMGDEARALAAAARRREHPPPGGRSRDRRRGARRSSQTDPDVGARTVLVVAGEGWHRGVIGIVASKLVDAFHRPAIVLSIDGRRGARLVPQHPALRHARRARALRARCCIRFGGHKQAAGLTMEARAHPGAARARSTTSPTRRSGPDDLMPRLRIDGDLTFRGITGGVAAGVASLAPFGAGNPRPVFAARGVEIVDGPRKLKERHLKMALKQDGRIFRAIAWRAAERHDYLTEHKAALDVAFSLEQNQYNGETYLELTLADVEAAQRSDQPCAMTALAATRARWSIAIVRRRRSRCASRVAFKRRDAAGAPAAVVRTDPEAVVESTGGDVVRVKRAARGRPRRLRAAADLRGRLDASCIGVKVVTDRARRRPHVHDDRQGRRASARTSRRSRSTATCS